jgi:hypothetical protein
VEKAGTGAHGHADKDTESRNDKEGVVTTKNAYLASTACASTDMIETMSGYFAEDYREVNHQKEPRYVPEMVRS